MNKLLIIFLILLSACSPEHKYLRSEYHKDLATYLNLKDEEDLMDFKIIDKNYGDTTLDLKYLIFTLSNYLNSPSKFDYENEQYIEYAIDVGLITQYKNKYVSREKAQQLFELATQIKENNIGNYDHSIYKDSFKQESEVNEIYESIDFEYNGDLDYNRAEIEEYFNFIPSEVEENENYRMLGETLASKSYKYGDYKITYVVTSTDIKIKAENEKLNGTFFVQSEINNLNLKTKIKANNKEDYTYFKVDFRTEESLGFRKGTYKDRYADLKNIDRNNVLNSLSKMFKPKSEIAETSIDLFEIKVPIDKMGALKVTLQVKIHFYASGRVELTFNTDNSFGFERVDSKVRFINKMDKNMDFVARASSDATSSLTVGLKSGKTRIGDVRFEAGVSGYLKNNVHIFNEDKHFIQETDLPGDYVSELLETNDDLKMCSDLSLYWLLKVTINSNGTLLSKVGVSHTYDVFGENKQLIKGPIHLENFLEVDRCSVKNKDKQNDEKLEISEEKLVPETYFKSLKTNQEYTIKFKEIPSGYSLNDIMYQSNNQKIVKVENGAIKAIAKGSAEITIFTKDNKYRTSMSVLINE